MSPISFSSGHFTWLTAPRSGTETRTSLRHDEIWIFGQGGGVGDGAGVSVDVGHGVGVSVGVEVDVGVTVEDGTTVGVEIHCGLE